MGGIGSYGNLDADVVRSLKEYPTTDLIRVLFPDRVVKSRGVMCSPFRNERHPSFSCFKGREGVSLWKDHATGDSGDNIRLYQMVFPGLKFDEAVDALAMLLLGRSAYRQGHRSSGRRAVSVASGAFLPSVPSPVRSVSEGGLRILRRLPVGDAECPEYVCSYWRNRGISDETMRDMGARVVEYENVNSRGTGMVDSVSGLPILDSKGNTVVDDGIHYGVGVVNDVGGTVVREPDKSYSRGFKGNIGNQFITTVLADGSRPRHAVVFVGRGSDRVEGISYNGESGFLYVNGAQGFGGVSADTFAFAYQVLLPYVGRVLDDLDKRRIAVMLDALNAPVASKVVVVEGIFDGLSYMEMNRMRSGGVLGVDMVILNSVSNLRFAVPFVCRHDQAFVMMDNDVRTGAGHKAFREMCDAIGAFNGNIGHFTVVRNSSDVYGGFKDLNEAVMARKGFPQGYRPVADMKRRPKKDVDNNVKP